MNSFLDIPKVCLYEIILRWISCHELCFLDSAVVSKALRVSFLNILTSDNYLMSIEVDRFNAFNCQEILFLRWLNLRGLQCDELIVGRKVLKTIELERTLVQSSFKSMKSLSINHCTSLKFLEFALITFPVESLSLLFLPQISHKVLCIGKKLTSVNFSFSDCLTSNLVTTFCDSHRSTLTSFDASYCSKKFDAKCVELVCSMENISTFRIPQSAVHVNYITPRDLCEVIKLSYGLLNLKHGHLVELNISGYLFGAESHITNKNVLTVLKLNPNLKILNVNRCYQLVSDGFLKELGSCCPLLESLDIGCRPSYSDVCEWTQAGVNIISKTLQRLKSLNLLGLDLALESATEMLRLLPNLCDISVQNNYRDSDVVCFLLCSSFASVANFVMGNSYDGLRIAGVRLPLITAYTTADALTMFDAASNGVGILECLPTVPTLHMLAITGGLVHYWPYCIESGLCSNLTTLTLTWDWNYDLICCVSKQCLALVKLALVGPFDEQVRDSDVVEICSNLSRLTHLHLMDLDISNVALQDGVIKFMRKLIYLDLTLKKVTPPYVAAAISVNKSLQIVNLECCKVKRISTIVTDALKSLDDLCQVTWDGKQWWSR